MADDGDGAGDGEGLDTTSKPVKTYIPAYQKEEWETHADGLDMSLSEFIRTMTQAGRRGYLDVVDLDSEPFDSLTDAVDDEDDEEDERDHFERMVLQVIREAGPIEYDMLVAAAQDHIESRLNQILDDLQADGEIIHAPGQGYTVDEGGA